MSTTRIASLPALAAASEQNSRTCCRTVFTIRLSSAAKHPATALSAHDFVSTIPTHHSANTRYSGPLTCGRCFPISLVHSSTAAICFLMVPSLLHADGYFCTVTMPHTGSHSLPTDTKKEGTIPLGQYRLPAGEGSMEEITITALGVHIKVADLARSQAFYEAFSFQQIGAFEGGIVYGVGGVALLELNDRHPAVASDVFQRPITTAKTSLLLKVPSLIPVLMAAERAHISLAVPPRRFPWKTIEVVFRDPDGFVVVFLTPDTATEFRAVQARTAVDLDRAR